MNPVIGWALVVLAVALGYSFWGWAGVGLALTGVVFWLLLQFTRTLRVMRMAAARPVGVVDSAVMLNARVHPGMTMLQLLPLTRSLGVRLSVPGAEPERFVWRDPGDDVVEIELRAGRVTLALLRRAAAADGTGATTGASRGESPGTEAAPRIPG